jgi:PD-(D/E)XK nuclease superfamily
MPDEFWLDNSKIETFKLCPQKYQYRYEEHLVPVDRKRESALMFGGAIHSALETLYRGTAFNKANCPLHSADMVCARCRGGEIPNISAVFLSQYQDDPEDPKEIRTVDRGLDILAQYLGKWRREPFKVIYVEEPFEMPMAEDGIKFLYIGRMDLVVEQDGTIFPVDHKTTTRFGQVFDTSFKLSGQFTGYMRAAERKTGQPVFTALANALRVTSKIDDSSFARIFTQRTPEEFERWETEVGNAARQIVEMRNARFWPRNAPFACGAYNRVCEYYPLCISAAQTQETLKRSAYEVVPWEPRKVEHE